MMALRPFLPENWTSNLLSVCGGPAFHECPARTKPEIAPAQIDRMISTGVRFDGELADAGYGVSAPFRQSHRRRRA
jgi:SRSO17 transposase